jgi:two-component system sensor histidine kinase BarA
VATGDLTDTPWLAPSELEDAAVDASQPQPLPESLDVSVLLAEDFRDTRELIRSALEHSGASVVAVQDGQEAVDAAARQRFDLILLDIRMPGVDGREAAERIRKGGCTAPIVALTASVAPSGFGSLLAAGFDDVWAKPITINDLTRRVARFARTPTAGAHLPPTTQDDQTGDSTPKIDVQAKLAGARTEFIASLPEKIGVLRDAARQRDRSVVHEKLHQLVGSAGIYGLMDVSNEAARLLKRAKIGELDGRPEEFDGLARMVDHAGETPQHPHRVPADHVRPE